MLLIALLYLCWIYAPAMSVGVRDTHDIVYFKIPEATRIAVWRSRAFLLVPSVRTYLLEVPWQPGIEEDLPRVRKFPLMTMVRRCHGLQAISDIRIDPFGRLWVLDSGTDSCPPKLLIYDLMLYRFTESRKHVFRKSQSITDFVVDAGSSRALSMAYLAGKDSLHVYSLYQDRSWTVQPDIQGKITGLTINKGGLYYRAALFVEVDQQSVYQIFTSALIESDVHAEMIGSLLGRSAAGILGDNRGGIVYVMAADYAALRWDSSLALEAESHDVLLQDFDLLHNVTYLVMDSQKHVWALVSNQTVWCVKLI